MSPFEHLQIDVRSDRPRRAILVLSGELDHASADDVRRAVDQAAADGYAEVVIDLSELSFMDGGGLSLLFELGRRPVDTEYSMVDGSAAASHLLGLLSGPRPLPVAQVEPSSPPE